MPFLAALIPLLPTIAAAASLAGTGVGLGLELSNMPGGAPPTPQTPQTPSPTGPTLAQTNAGAVNTQKALESNISSQFPSLQQQVGGSLSPEALINLSSLVTGNAGNPGIGGVNVDLISKLLTGNTGGSGGPQVTAGSGTVPTPGSPGLTNSTFG